MLYDGIFHVSTIFVHLATIRRRCILIQYFIISKVISVSVYPMPTYQSFSKCPIVFCVKKRILSIAILVPSIYQLSFFSFCVDAETVPKIHSANILIHLAFILMYTSDFFHNYFIPMNGFTNSDWCHIDYIWK